MRISSIGVDFTLARLFNERTDKGLLAYHKLGEANDQVRIPQHGRRFLRSSRRVAASARAAISTAGSADRSAWPIRSAKSCASWPRRSTTVRSQIEKPEERIELTAAARAVAPRWPRDHGLARAARPTTVYWVGGRRAGPRLRVRLASAPLDVGPSLRQHAFRHRSRPAF